MGEIIVVAFYSFIAPPATRIAGRQSGSELVEDFVYIKVAAVMDDAINKIKRDLKAGSKLVGAKRPDGARGEVGEPKKTVIIPRYTGEQGRLIRVDDESMEINDKDVAKLEDFAKLAKAIDSLKMGKYYKAKDDSVWFEIYGGVRCGQNKKECELTIMTPEGEFKRLAYKADEKIIPCHYCGVVLPFDYIQIDHHIPQATNKPKKQPDKYTQRHVIKMLRAFGLTDKFGPVKLGGKLPGLPTGAKGSAVFNGKSGKGDLKGLVINPKGWDRGQVDKFRDKTPLDKWITNHDGDLFLSLLACGASYRAESNKTDAAKNLEDMNIRLEAANEKVKALESNVKDETNDLKDARKSVELAEKAVEAARKKKEEADNIALMYVDELWEDLNTICENNLINLVPLCAKCNKSKGELMKVIDG